MAIQRPITLTQISTTNWGIPITDEVNALRTLINSMQPTVWAAVIFQNGWLSNVGSQAVQYRKVLGDMVHVRGVMHGPAGGSSAFTLPVGFRPPVSYDQVTASWSGSAGVGLLIVGADGTCIPYGGVTEVGLNFIFSTTA